MSNVTLITKIRFGLRGPQFFTENPSSADEPDTIDIAGQSNDDVVVISLSVDCDVAEFGAR